MIGSTVSRPGRGYWTISGGHEQMIGEVPYVVRSDEVWVRAVENVERGNPICSCAVPSESIRSWMLWYECVRTWDRDEAHV